MGPAESFCIQDDAPESARSGTHRPIRRRKLFCAIDARSIEKVDEEEEQGAGKEGEVLAKEKVATVSARRFGDARALRSPTGPPSARSSTRAARVRPERQPLQPCTRQPHPPNAEAPELVDPRREPHSSERARRVRKHP